MDWFAQESPSIINRTSFYSQKYLDYDEFYALPNKVNCLLPLKYWTAEKPTYYIF